MYSGLRIEKIIFLGDVNNSSINFSNPVHFVHGASNTGKSLLVEAIDYMLGKSKLRQVVPQSEKYNEIAMQVTLDGEFFTLFRKWPSDLFEVYRGFVEFKDEAKFYNYFRHKTPTQKIQTINEFYFKNNERPELLTNLYGEKNALTIRLLSRIIISGEEKIISSDSPVIAGDTSENSKNRYVFKYLLTGKDDSKVKTLARGTEFKSEKKGKVEVLEEVVSSLEIDLNFPDESIDSLNQRVEKIDISINEILTHIGHAQEKLSEIVTEKKSVAQHLMSVAERINIISANLSNFETLKKLYSSDIERLSSQEEAAFLLGLGHNGQCEFCGKIPQTVCLDLSNIMNLAEASKAEIVKIKSKHIELEVTSEELKKQLALLTFSSNELQTKLTHLDCEVEKRAPALKLSDNNLMAFRNERASVQADLILHVRVSSFKKRLQETELAASPKQYKSENFYPQADVIDSFCQIYSTILAAINFPGDHKVEFDHKKIDVIIDGVPRDLNGKGVRAILHSVFKVALLQHCRKKNIYHPGIVILDSPLVTYRDPLNSKHGDLDNDEKNLAETKISYYFLNFLYENSELGQFIIIENIDMPESLKDVIGIDTFYGKSAASDQRAGLLS
jgi:hypothetical protein